MANLRLILALALVAQTLAVYNASYHEGAFWRLNCHGRPIFQGRADNIVNVGQASGHVHKVFGGNSFNAGKTTEDPLATFAHMRNSTCTNCAVQTADLSNYWHPELYYVDAQGKFSAVSGEGIIIYYFSNPNAQAFPPGLRVVAGDSSRRSFNSSEVTHTAVSYVCLQNGGAAKWTDDGAGFPTKHNFCNNILRAQIFFPQCWDGKNLDSADHKSHMSYPIGMDHRHGNCPASHPIRVPCMFWEVIYNTGWYPHGDGTQRFVWANGDRTGFGFHADFMNGWDQKILQMAIQDTTCGGDGEITHCDTFKPYLKDNYFCELRDPITSTEDIGMGSPLNALPGCNKPTDGPAAAKPPCSTVPKQSTTISAPKRVTFQSKKTKGFLTAPFDWSWGALFSRAIPTIDSTWTIYNYADGNMGLRNGGNGNYIINWNFGTPISRSGSAEGNTWAMLTVVPQANGFVAIKSVKDGTWLKVQADGTFNYNQWGSPTDDCMFTMAKPNGGSIVPGGDPILADNIMYAPKTAALVTPMNMA